MDGVELSADQAAVAAGLWSQARRRREHRQRRERREHLGELVQMDGSFHQWFEDHGPKGCLMALCTDWKAVYAMKPSEQQLLRGEVPRTQFGQLCGRLRIRIIPANFPETKGRVERNHGTHQDRLVKKLRRKKIQSYEMGRLQIRYRGQKVAWEELAGQPQPPTAEKKEKKTRPYGGTPPATSHPWKRSYREMTARRPPVAAGARTSI